jgi:hypothetical protein
MIATISSAESSFEETQNTLKYANRAKNIKTNAQRNVLNVNYHISEYVQLITNLRAEIKSLKDQLVKTEVPVAGNSFIPRARVSRDYSSVNDRELLLQIEDPIDNLGVELPMISQSPASRENNQRNAVSPLQMLRESMKSGIIFSEVCDRSDGR